MVTRATLGKWRPQRESKEARAHRHAAVRMIAALIAVEAPTSGTKHRGNKVALIHRLARRIAALGLRLTYDGDRYYVTYPAPTASPPGPHLGTLLDGVPGAITETLLVAGRADTLEELARLVDGLGTGG
jgi:hypothetical protein